MSPIVITMIVIAAVVVAILILAVWLAKKRKELGIERKTDYRMFFRTGIGMIVIGIIGLIPILLLTEISFTVILPLFTIGVVFIAIGHNKKETWTTK